MTHRRRSPCCEDEARRYLAASDPAAPSDAVRAALEWYADPDNWGQDEWGVPSVIDPPDYGDPGATARAALRLPAAAPVDVLRSETFREAVQETFDAPGEWGPAQGYYRGDVLHFIDMLVAAYNCLAGQSE